MDIIDVKDIAVIQAIMRITDINFTKTIVYNGHHAQYEVTYVCHGITVLKAIMNIMVSPIMDTTH